MPTLDLLAFKKHIAQRTLQPMYVFVGEDLKLLDRLVDDVESTVDEGDRPFAVDRLYAADPGGSPVDIAASARGLPMLGDKRIVIVLRAERLLKPKRATKPSDDLDEGLDEGGGEATDMSALEAYIADPASSATLVFVATDVDKSRRLTKRLFERAFVVECWGLRAGSGPAKREIRTSASVWLQDELRRSGRTIDPDAGRMLAGRSGNDITKLRGDIERLLLFVGGRKNIALDDVLEVVAETGEVEDEWAVTNAISSGDPAAALTAAAARLERGDSPHALLGQLRWWVSTRLAEADPGRVKPALDALLRTDLALKSSGGEERILMERLVVELTGRPVGRPAGSWQR